MKKIEEYVELARRMGRLSTITGGVNFFSEVARLVEWIDANLAFQTVIERIRDERVAAESPVFKSSIELDKVLKEEWEAVAPLLTMDIQLFLSNKIQNRHRRVFSPREYKFSTDFDELFVSFPAANFELYEFIIVTLFGSEYSRLVMEKCVQDISSKEVSLCGAVAAAYSMFDRESMRLNNLREKSAWGNLGMLHHIVAIYSKSDWRERLEKHSKVVERENCLVALYALSNFIYDHLFESSRPTTRATLLKDSIPLTNFKLVGDDLFLGEYGKVETHPTFSPTQTGKKTQGYLIIEKLLQANNKGVKRVELIDSCKSTSKYFTSVVSSTNRLFHSAFSDGKASILLSIEPYGPQNNKLYVLRAVPQLPAIA